MHSSSKKNQEPIKAYLRIKPLINQKLSNLTVLSDRVVIVKGQSEYKFDKVFTAEASNAEVFQEIGDPLIQHSLQGYNASVLAYGQTSSGKTYTMKGDGEREGIIPQVIQKLFKSIDEGKLTAQISISYMEIYNENIIDLLSNSQNSLQIQEKALKNPIITNLIEAEVDEVETAMKLLQKGEAKRKISSNNINHNSSRSHTIFRISVAVVREDLTKTQSHINMVDLAGSEGVNRTKAEGATKKQGQNINKSILALTNVFRTMSEKHSYINFRDSKLTRLLQSSFCSNSRSIVICTVNPLAENYQETMNTLKFSTYATEIKLDVKKNLKETGGKESEGSLNISSQALISHKNESADLMEGEKLTPSQRIELQENKKIIFQLRQSCHEYRQMIKQLNKKIQFSELENQKLLSSLENKEQMVKVYEEKIRFQQNYNKDDDMLIYQKEISHLKQQVNMLVNRQEALNELYNKTLKNQAYLVDRVAKYESQITLLKEAAANETEKEVKMKPKTPIKTNPNLLRKPKWEEPLCPLTIGSMVRLKASIIELKKTLFDANEQIAKLIEERNELAERVGELEDDGDDRRYTGKHSISQAEDKQMRGLHIRIKKLKKQIEYHKNYQQKLLKKLKDKTYKGMEDINEFQQWYQKKRLEESEKKRAREKENGEGSNSKPQFFKYQY